MKPGDFFSVWKKVFSEWKYVLITIVIALFFYSTNVFISKFSSVVTYYNSLGFFKGTKLFFTLIIYFGETIILHSFISLIIISILLGILFSFILYKTKILESVSKKTGAFTTIGIFLGVLAPGCVACGIGLLSVFGLSAAAITFLPFDGLELSILAIIILGFSTLKITEEIHEGIICKIN